MKEDVPGSGDGAWLEFLTNEDLSFLKRFLLASGSLKELAKVYGISYPTVRLRLDRMIAKVTVVDNHRDRDEFERMVRGLFAEGRFDMDTLKLLLRAHQEEKDDEHNA